MVQIIYFMNNSVIAIKDFNLLLEQFSDRNQGFCKRLSCQMSFTNVHNEFKTKLRKTGGDFIVHSSDFTLHSSYFTGHTSHFQVF